MINSLRIWPWLVLLGLAASAGADEVVLKNGQKLEGTVEQKGNKIIVDVGPGTITLDRSEVSSINRPYQEIDEFDRRFQSLSPDDVDGYYQLYLWSRQQPGIKTRAESLLKKILEINPNHEQARRALGYVNFKGAWLTQDEFKAAALGLVRYNGQWMAADVAEKLKKLDQDYALSATRQAAEEQAVKVQAALEADKISQRQRVVDMMLAGELPWYAGNALGYPYLQAMRYWGPAAAQGPQPNAD